MRAFDAAEVREPNFCGVAAGGVAFEQRQLEFDVLTVLRVLGLQIPLALVGAAVGPPAETDGTVRQRYPAGLVKGDCLPLRIVGRTELVA